MTSILILTSLLILSLLAVHLVNQRQERIRQLRLGQMRLRWEIEELEEILVGVEALLSDRTIARCINREILHRLEQMREQQPGDTAHLDTRIEHVREREQEMLSQREQSQASRLQESDAEMVRAEESLDRAARVLRRQHSEGRLEGSLNEYLQELTWARLTVDVITYVAEGHKALARGDITTSHAWYKKAQGVLIGSEHPYPQRMTMIRELGDIIQGKRWALSPDLMPEADYNP